MADTAKHLRAKAQHYKELATRLTDKSFVKALVELAERLETEADKREQAGDTTGAPPASFQEAA